MSLTDTLLAHATTALGQPVERARWATSPTGDDLDAVHDLITLAQDSTGDPAQTGALLDQAIQTLVSVRHNLDPGHPVARVVPELRAGLVLMEAPSDRWCDQEWRRSRKYPDVYVDQYGVPCSPQALPASLVVVEQSTERNAR